MVLFHTIKNKLKKKKNLFNLNSRLEVECVFKTKKHKNKNKFQSFNSLINIDHRHLSSNHFHKEISFNHSILYVIQTFLPGWEDHKGALRVPDQGRAYLRGRDLQQERRLPRSRHARRHQIDIPSGPTIREPVQKRKTSKLSKGFSTP